MWSLHCGQHQVSQNSTKTIKQGNLYTLAGTFHKEVFGSSARSKYESYSRTTSSARSVSLMFKWSWGAVPPWKEWLGIWMNIAWVNRCGSNVQQTDCTAAFWCWGGAAGCGDVYRPAAVVAQAAAAMTPQSAPSRRRGTTCPFVWCPLVVLKCPLAKYSEPRSSENLLGVSQRV